VLIHPFSSLLSAYGMGLADIAAQRAQGVDEPLRIDALVRVAVIADELSAAAVAEVEGQGVAREAIKVHRRAQLRYSGSDTTIEVPLSTPAAMRRVFQSAHKSRFGFIDKEKAIVIEAVSVEAVGGAARLVAALDERGRRGPKGVRKDAPRSTGYRPRLQDRAGEAERRPVCNLLAAHDGGQSRRVHRRRPSDLLFRLCAGQHPRLLPCRA
jgi:N-methylhydantoinase A/oxoprolinase/acetone carboxylase beta subunit